MFRSCLLALALYAAVAVGYYYWLRTVFDPPEVYWGAGILGFVVFCCIGALMNARSAWRDWSLASSARANEPLRDGRLIVAAGPIQPVGEPVLAPFSNQPCCLCEYDLSQEKQIPSDEEKNTGSDLAGFLMAPSEVHTQAGKIKVLGFPILEEGTKHTLSSFTAARRARDFVSRTQFEDISGLRLVNVFTAIQDAWTDEDGRVEKNLQLKKVDPQKLFPDDLEAVWQELHAESPGALEADEADTGAIDEEELDETDDDDLDEDGAPLPSLQMPKLQENRVAPGEAVCIIGKYDELQHGIRPVGAGLQALRLIRGDLATLEKKSRSSLWSHLFGSIFFLILAHAVTYGVMMLYLYADSNVRKRESQAFTAAQKGDLPKLQRLFDQKLNPDARDSSQHTLLMEAKDAATARLLIERGVPVDAQDQYGQTALLHAAERNDLELAKTLLAAKADINLRSKARRSPLSRADHLGHAEMAKLLREAGAEDDVVTAATGTPLPADGGEQLAAIKAYQQAIKQRDRAKLNALALWEVPETIDAETWNNWQLSVFNEIVAFEGFTRADLASVRVIGTWGDTNANATFHFQLRRVAGMWKIAEARFELN